jgi:hypothetical protein
MGQLCFPRCTIFADGHVIQGLAAASPADGRSDQLLARRGRCIGDRWLGRKGGREGGREGLWRECGVHAYIRTRTLTHKHAAYATAEASRCPQRVGVVMQHAFFVTLRGGLFSTVFLRVREPLLLFGLAHVLINGTLTCPALCTFMCVAAFVWLLYTGNGMLNQRTLRLPAVGNALAKQLHSCAYTVPHLTHMHTRSLCISTRPIALSLASLCCALESDTLSPHPLIALHLAAPLCSISCPRVGYAACAWLLFLGCIPKFGN